MTETVGSSLVSPTLLNGAVHLTGKIHSSAEVRTDSFSKISTCSEILTHCCCCRVVPRAAIQQHDVRGDVRRAPEHLPKQAAVRQPAGRAAAVEHPQVQAALHLPRLGRCHHCARTGQYGSSDELALPTFATTNERKLGV